MTLREGVYGLQKINIMQLFDKSVFGLSDILPVSKNQLYCPIYQTTFLLVKCVFVAIDKQFDGKFPQKR